MCSLIVFICLFTNLSIQNQVCSEKNLREDRILNKFPFCIHNFEIKGNFEIKEKGKCVYDNKSDVDTIGKKYYVKRSSLFENNFISKTTINVPLTPPQLLNGTKPEVIIAILAPNTTRHFFRLRLAYLAVDYARNTHPLAKKLFNEQCKLTIKQADTDCDLTAAPINAYNLYHKDKIHVVFGPICDYSLAPVARYSRYWNLAVITPGGMSGYFGRDKTKADPEFPLLTRIGPTFDGVARCLHAILKQFNWDNVFMLVDSDGGAHITPRLCNFAMSDVVFMLTQESFRYKLSQMDEPEHLRNYSQILTREIGLEYSIIVLCASPDSLREIMIKAAEMHFNNGEYVFLNVDLFTNYLNNSLKPWYRQNDTDERNRLARKGFETLLTITMRKPDSIDYKKFSNEIKKKKVPTATLR